MSVLWICHTCEMIGSQAEALAHRIATGHEVERLDNDTSEAIRDEWSRQRAERAVAFLNLAKLGMPAEGGHER